MDYDEPIDGYFNPLVSRPLSSADPCYERSSPIVKFLKLNFEEHFLLYALDDGTIVFVSSLCESVFGCHPLALVGRNVYDLLLPEDILAIEGCLSDGLWYQVHHCLSGVGMWTELDEILLTDQLEKCMSTASSLAAAHDFSDEMETSDYDCEAASPLNPSVNFSDLWMSDIHANFEEMTPPQLMSNGYDGVASPQGVGTSFTDYHKLQGHMVPDVVSDHQRCSEGLYTNGASFMCREGCHGQNQVVVRCSACLRSFCEVCAVARHHNLSSLEASTHQLVGLGRSGQSKVF